MSPKLIDAGVTAICGSTGATPLPVSDTGIVPNVPKKLNVQLCVPGACGVNVAW